MQGHRDDLRSRGHLAPATDMEVVGRVQNGMKYLLSATNRELRLQIAKKKVENPTPIAQPVHRDSRRFKVGNSA